MKLVKFFQLGELHTLNLKHYGTVKFALDLEQLSKKQACLSLRIDTKERVFKISCAVQIREMDRQTYAKHALYFKQNKELLLEEVVLGGLYKQTLNVILSYIAKLVFGKELIKTSNVFYESF